MLAFDNAFSQTDDALQYRCHLLRVVSGLSISSERLVCRSKPPEQGDIAGFFDFNGLVNFVL